MALRLVIVYLLLVLALHSAVEDLHDCESRYRICAHAEAAMPNTQTRKLLSGSEDQVLKSSSKAPKAGGSDVIGWTSLRSVPQGPDPLHHNNKDPRKPHSP